MKNRIFIPLLLVVLAGGISFLVANQEQSEPFSLQEVEASALQFIKNEGQWEQDFDYLVNLNGGNILVAEDHLYYSFYKLPQRAHPHGKTRMFGADKVKPKEDEYVKGHVLRVDFLGANQQVDIEAKKPFEMYHNYFLGNDESRWRGHVPLYGELQHKQLYPGVDMRMYGSGDNFKYDLIVAAGADPAQIQIAYEGADLLYLKEGNLHINTSIRNLVEEAPIVYQRINGELVEVPCQFVLENNAVGFSFPQGYDDRYELVIDPTLEFSTYTGSRADNWGFTATYDLNGSLYGGGIIFAPNNGLTIFPVTTGAYQVFYGGGDTECTISKFSPDGTTMQYATYLGGSNLDQPQSLFVNDRGELYVYGRTSSTNFPTTSGAYDRGYNGGRFDIFVAKFNAAGSQLLGSTFLGGSDSDGENGNFFQSGVPNIVLQTNYGDDARGEIILDDQSNCYIAACTRSSNFPTTNGAVQRNLGGFQDGVVVKLNSNLTALIFSTYLGGSNHDAAYGMKLDASNNVYVTGGTASSNFPTTNGVLYPNYRGGSIDGFISKISANGRTLMNSTFIGTASSDQSYFLEIDENFDIYVTGQTLGSFPINGNVYSNPGSRQFIAKLDGNLNNFIYSTVFGSGPASQPNISPTAFLVDRCDNVYVAGWGGSTNFGGNTRNMPITPDAIQSNTDGSDFYMIVLERDARNLLYGSYLGGTSLLASGEHVDGGTCRFDREGIIYHAVCAGCGGLSTFPTTPGVVSTTNNSSNCNLAAFKIAFDLAGIKADFIPLDRLGDTLEFKGCPPLLVNIDNISKATPQTNYFWDWGDGSQSSSFEPSHVYQDSGLYLVQLIIEDSATCNIRDTAYANILVYAEPEVEAGLDQIICLGDSVDITAVGDPTIVSYQWGPNAAMLNADSSTATVFPGNNINYVVTARDTNGCVTRDTMAVLIDQSLEIFPRPDTIVCEGVSSPLFASTTNGVIHSWSPADKVLDPNSLSTIATPDTTTTYVITAVNARGCVERDSVRIEVFEVYTLEDTSICIGDTILMRTNNGVSFNWRPNYNMSDPDAISPLIWPLVDTLYIVRAVSSDGCISEKGVQVDVDDLPIPEAGLPDTICIGTETRLQASGGFLYNWYPNENIDDSTRADPLVFPTQTQYYYVAVTDTNFCTDVDSVLVWVNPLPTIEAGPQTTICVGDSIELYATGAISYNWVPDPTLSATDIPNPIASPDIPTLYIVSGTDENGCINDTTVAIDLVDPPQVEIDGENYLCVGGQIELTAIGGQRVTWSTGDTNRTIGVTPVAPTTFYVTAFIGLCEGETDSITVDVDFDYPTASFVMDPTGGWAPQPVQFTNTSSENSVRFLWDFGTGAPTSDVKNPLYTFPFAGDWPIMMIAYSSTGCADTAFADILLENVALHVPSAFTPNADNFNDQFYVGYYGIVDLNVKIFSRWGMLIYEANDKDFRWDGTYKGEHVPEGVYVYVIEGVGENGLKYPKKGTVTVFR